MKRLNFLISFLVVSVLYSCNDSLDSEIYFVGDSLIARWDLKSSFPSHIVINDGLSGARIDYIESHAGLYSGNDVVVMIGTNDLYRLKDYDTLSRYADEYIQALTNLDATHIYLFSILPRNFAGENHQYLNTIIHLNTLINDRAKNYPSITYIDVYDKFLLDPSHINPQYFSDGLHLTPQGYEILHNSLTLR